MNSLCHCNKPLFEHASDFMVREGHACRGDCQKVRKGGSLPVLEALPPRKSKYGNVRSACSYGHTHASKKEAAHCNLLHLRLAANEISDLCCQPVYRFETNGILIGKYTGDFRYMEDGVLVVVDTKCQATKTIATNLRMKMMRAFFGIVVKEI